MAQYNIMNITQIKMNCGGDKNGKNEIYEHRD